MMNQPRNEKQKIDGIIIVDKPLNLTSNAVLQKVKHLFNAKKAGHTGSLDPLATGMLPLCFGEATKFSQYLLDADKCYEVTGCLGIKTTTGDAAGDILTQVDNFNISEAALRDVLTDFLGTTAQVPSMFSALKHQGTPLYRLARSGIEVERKAREITIHALTLNRFDGKFFQLTVVCSKGTYIRNLVEDIGERLNVGAYVTKLHRAYTAGLATESMYTLDELVELSAEQRLQCLLPMERAIDHFPPITLSTETAYNLRLGRPITHPDLLNFYGYVRLYDENGQFLGLGESDATEQLKVKRLLSNNES